MTRNEYRAVSALLDSLYKLSEDLMAREGCAVISLELEETVTKLENVIVQARCKQILKTIETRNLYEK